MACYMLAKYSRECQEKLFHLSWIEHKYKITIVNLSLNLGLKIVVLEFSNMNSQNFAGALLQMGLESWCLTSRYFRSTFGNVATSQFFVLCKNAKLCPQAHTPFFVSKFESARTIRHVIAIRDEFVEIHVVTTGLLQFLRATISLMFLG